MAIIKLLDPFGWAGESVSDRDGEVRESAVLDVAVWRVAEGVDVPDETGFKELNGFIKVIHLLLMAFFLGGELLVELA